MKLDLRTKLMGPSIIIMLTIIIMAVVYFFSLQALSDAENKSAELFHEFSASHQINTALAIQVIKIHDYALSGSIKHQAQLDHLTAKTDAAIENLRDNFPLTTPEKKILENIVTIQANIKNKTEQIYTITNPIGNKKSDQIIKAIDRNNIKAFVELNKFLLIDRKEIKAASRQATAAQRGQYYFMVGMAFILAIIIFSVFFITNNVAKPLSQLCQGAEKLEHGDFSAHIDLKTGDQLENLAATFNQMAFNLQQEHQTAANIQRRLLPAAFPKIPGIKVHSRQALAKIVGGDWYDYYQLDNDLIFLVADASGKGMPGALLSTVTMATMRSEPKRNMALPELLLKTNRTVVKRLGSGDFVTMFIARVNAATRELVSVNCGHEPPLLFRADSASWSIFKASSGLPIGISETLFQPKIEKTLLRPGDRLLLYTDGLHDIRNQKGEFFRLEPALNWLEKNKSLPLRTLVDGLIDRTMKFGNQKIIDDITLLGIEF